MIGQKIKNRRIELGLSQEDLAKLTGYDNRATISRIENGSIDLNVSKVDVFAKALNVSQSYLMGWEESNSKADPKDDRIVVLARNAKELTDDQIELIENMIDQLNKQNGG